MLLGAIGEWIVGNTFPFVVFGTFGKLPPHIPSLHPEEQHGQSIPPLPFRRLLAHLRRHPRTLIQRIRRLRDRTRTNGWAEWKSGKSGRVTDTGVQCQLCVFSSLHGCVRFHYYSVQRRNWLTRACVGVVCFIFLICSLRTNIVFFLIFLSLIGAFGCLAGAYWNLALAYKNAANTMAAKRAGQLVVVISLRC